MILFQAIIIAFSSLSVFCEEKHLGDCTLICAIQDTTTAAPENENKTSIPSACGCNVYIYNSAPGEIPSGFPSHGDSAGPCEPEPLIEPKCYPVIFMKGSVDLDGPASEVCCPKPKSVAPTCPTPFNSPPSGGIRGFICELEGGQTSSVCNAPSSGQQCTCGCCARQQCMGSPRNPSVYMPPQSGACPCCSSGNSARPPTNIGSGQGFEFEYIPIKQDQSPPPPAASGGYICQCVPRAGSNSHSIPMLNDQLIPAPPALDEDYETFLCNCLRRRSQGGSVPKPVYSGVSDYGANQYGPVSPVVPYSRKENLQDSQKRIIPASYNEDAIRPISDNDETICSTKITDLLGEIKKAIEGLSVSQTQYEPSQNSSNNQKSGNPASTEAQEVVFTFRLDKPTAEKKVKAKRPLK
ncbi:hypothetical protein ACOME3_005781 [Neoechinorhynchus agilis]